MAIAMRYGSKGESSAIGGDASTLYQGTINDATVITLVLEPSGLYELFTAEYNASTGAYRGAHIRYITTPEPSLFGTTASQLGGDYSSSNTGVTITANADSTVSISRSSSTYAVHYVVRAVASKLGNFTSTVSQAEAARDAAQFYASQASASASDAADSATAAAAAIIHYPKIENSYWYVWDVPTSAWVNTGIRAEGQTGATPNFSIGTVSTGAAGSSASASITGTAENPVLNLTIPRGDTGGYLRVTNVTVPTSAWGASALGSGFNYEASITLNGVDATMTPDVMFGVAEATSGNFAPVADVAANAVIIYAKTAPLTSITIPTILVHL